MDKIICNSCGKELTDENDVNVKWLNGMQHFYCTECNKKLKEDNTETTQTDEKSPFYEIRKTLEERNKGVSVSIRKNLEEKNQKISASIRKNLEEKNQKHVASTVFIVIDCIVGLIGFILGIISGNTYPIITVEKYTDIFNETSTESVKNFNTPLMWYVWIATAILLCILIGITIIIRNQEKFMTYLKNRKD